MKQKLKLWNVAAAIAVCLAICMIFAGCSDSDGSSGDSGGGSYKIKMTTEAEKVDFYLKGSGVATFDWGDGSKKVSLTLNDGEYTTGTRFEHTYPNASIRTITVNGNNITFLNCMGNKLTTLDVSKITSLTILYCGENKLTALDVSKNTEMTGMNCAHNSLTRLDVSKNTSLIYLYCFDNKFTAEGLNALFGTLHSNAIEGEGQEKEIFISSNPGTDSCDASKAESKGWSVNTSFQ